MTETPGVTAPVGVIARVWRIDLETAQRLLPLFRTPEKGVKGTNRKWSPLIVNKYAFEMLAKPRSLWKFSHQGFAFIGFINDGTAVGMDGEQRLRALIQACTKGATRRGITRPPKPEFFFDVMITEGLDADSWLAMDIGKSRKPGDFMTSEGEVNANVLSSLVSLAQAYDNEPVGVPYLRERWISTLSPAERQDYLAANPALRDALVQGARLGKRMTVSAAAAAYFLAVKAGIKAERIGDFMDLLQSGAGMKGDDDPALVLRELLSNARNGRRKFSREEQLALFIKAFNKWNSGEKIKRQLSFKTKPVKVTRMGREMTLSAEVFPRFKV